MPGYRAVLAMHAFALEECGEYAGAEEAALAALELDPSDVRAHHAMAHIFEMTGRADAGVRWMQQHLARWGADSPARTHCAWHLALFHLGRGDTTGALSLYDEHVRAGHSKEIADLIDASALLWRVRLSRGIDTPARWAELAASWAPHIEDAFCSFNDVHAMLAFVGAQDWERAHRLEGTLVASQSRPSRHAETTRHIGLPACRALIAFGRGDNALATRLFASLSSLAHRLGGSHAQRDVLGLTLRKAAERLRRPLRRWCMTRRPLPAMSLARMAG
jgi:hypothetical protein